MLTDRWVNSDYFGHLTSEIHRLADQQIETLRLATFGGMTEDEANEYEHRGKQIGVLVNEFKALISKRTM